MRKIIRYALFLGIQFLSCDSFSQILYTLERKQNAVSLANGINKNELFTTLSYARGFHVNIFNILKDDITFFLDCSEQSDFKNDNAERIVYGGQASLYRKRSFMLLFRKTFTISRYKLMHNVKTTYFGAEFELMPGIYTSQFFIALDLYYGDKFKGYLTSEGNGTEVLQEIGKGWFKPRQAAFRTGINAGYHLNKHWTFFGNMDFFVVRPHDHQAYSPSTPHFFGYIGVNYIFPTHSTN